MPFTFERMESSNYPLFRKRTKVFLIFMLFIGIIACQKEEFWPERISSPPGDLLNEVKNWFKNAEKAGISTAAPEWSKSWIAVSGRDAGIVKIPLKNYQFADSIYWDILFQKENRTIYARLIQVKVGPKYLAEKRSEQGNRSFPIREYIENRDFTGDIFLYDLNGRFLMGRRFEAGILKNLLYPKRLFKNLQARARKPLPKEPSWNDESDEGTGGTVDGGMLPGVVVTAPVYDNGGSSGSYWYIPSNRGSDLSYSGSNPRLDVPIGSHGGGGSGHSSRLKVLKESDLAEFEFVLDEGEPIENIEDYIECFNDGKTGVYKLALYVDQPVAGKNDQFGTNSISVGGIKIVLPTGEIVDVGHSFVTFKKENTDGTYVRQTFGFYPQQKPGSKDAHGIVKDNSGHPYDVGYVVTVTKKQFSNALNQVQQDIESEKEYVLSNIRFNEYNCSDAALSWLKAGDIEIPDASRGLFKNTPGDLGEELRKLPGAKTDSGKAGEGNGSCN